MPGTAFAEIDRTIAATLGLPSSARIAAGTTDGVAAFVATRADTPGDAVTSLGTTLVVKLLAAQPIFAASQGVYSHRLGESWLAGRRIQHRRRRTAGPFQRRRDGAPDAAIAAGGADRPRLLSARQARRALSDRRSGDAATGYTATGGGPSLLPGAAGGHRVGRGAGLSAARPARRAPALRRVISIGGGARNEAWTAIGHRALGVPVTVAEQTEASYGAALLALRGGPA